MELKWLKDFVALAEQGSFSKAAEARFVTQPAFSRRIRALEAWMGVALVQRDTYPLSFTKAGDAFIEQAQQMVGQIYATRTQMQDISSERQQLLMHAQHALAVSFFPSWMSTLQALTAGAMIKVDAGDLHASMEAFLRGNGDFLLAYSCGDIFRQMQRNDVQSLQVGLDQLVPVSAVNSDGEAIHTPISNEPLHLLSHSPDSFFGKLVQRECLPILPADISPHVVCENSLSEALKALVLKGSGIAWLPKSLIVNELETGQLKALIAPLQTLELKITLYRRQQEKGGAADQFWHYLQELYNQNAQAG